MQISYYTTGDGELYVLWVWKRPLTMSHTI